MGIKLNSWRMEDILWNRLRIKNMFSKCTQGIFVAKSVIKGKNLRLDLYQLLWQKKRKIKAQYPWFQKGREKDEQYWVSDGKTSSLDGWGTKQREILYLSKCNIVFPSWHWWERMWKQEMEGRRRSTCWDGALETQSPEKQRIMGVQIKLHRKGHSGLDLQETQC